MLQKLVLKKKKTLVSGRIKNVGLGGRELGYSINFHLEK